jgi:hypothetical protein
MYYLQNTEAIVMTVSDVTAESSQMECTAMQEWMLSSYPILKSMELRK